MHAFQALSDNASQMYTYQRCVVWLQELVRELVQTKNRLRSTEEELKAVRGYLDNLLLRIMETSPGILSVGTP